MFNLSFLTLDARFFLLLTGRFILVFLAAYCIREYFRYLGVYESDVFNKEIEKKKTIPFIIKLYGVPLLFIYFVSSVVLINAKTVEMQFLALSICTVCNGFMIGLFLIMINKKNLIYLLLLPILISLIASFISMSGYLLASWQGVGLFYAYLFVLVGLCIKLLCSVRNRQQMALLLFVLCMYFGYVTYDLNVLKKTTDVPKENNWNTAITVSTRIYLDLVNLLGD